MQLIYQMDASDSFESEAELLPRFFSNLAPEVPEEARAFAGELACGVAERLAELDELLERASQNWRLERMSRVDRSILRLATYELVATQGVPPRVVINEAIEIGKEFGATESAAFINGVLNRVAQDLGLTP